MPVVKVGGMATALVRCAGVRAQPLGTSDTSDEEEERQEDVFDLCPMVGGETIRFLRKHEEVWETLRLLLLDRLDALKGQPVCCDRMEEFSEKVTRVCDELRLGLGLPLVCMRSGVGMMSAGSQRTGFDVGSVVRHLWLLSTDSGLYEDILVRDALHFLFPRHREVRRFTSGDLDSLSWEQWAAWSLVCALIVCAVLGRVLDDGRIVSAALALLVSWEDAVKSVFVNPSAGLTQCSS